jgi:DNA invertase Pin-like site-specific DNA recombinase
MNKPVKIEPGTLHASMALAFAERVETRSALDFARAKDGATGVMWLPLSADQGVKIAGNPMARLTRASVNQMRELRASGRTFKSIAKQFGVSAMTAHRAITGGSWK